MPAQEKLYLNYIIQHSSPEREAYIVNLIRRYIKSNVDKAAVLPLIIKEYNRMTKQSPEKPKTNENKKEFVYNPNYSPDKLNKFGSEDLKKLSLKLYNLFNLEVGKATIGRPLSLFTDDNREELDAVIKENNPVLNACILYKAMN